MILSKKMVAVTGLVSFGDRELRPRKTIVFLLAFTLFFCSLLYHKAFRTLTISLPRFRNVSALEPSLFAAEHELDHTDTFEVEDMSILRRVLRETSMKENKTVIVTIMNHAWAEPNSTFDVFLDSFQAGQGTAKLLQHVVVVCLDVKAYSRCNEVHPHRCLWLKTTGVDYSGEKLFMVPDYYKMMWLRTELLGSFLKLGYNFLFTDMDTMWLRDPFPRLFSEVDFQVAGEYHHFKGNSSDLSNVAHGGFNFVVANDRTIKFYDHWYASRLRFPGKNEQNVLKQIKYDNYTKEIGLKMMFLDPVYFGNFCQPKWEINKVCLMHGNCCGGKRNKVKGLRQVLEDWRSYRSASGTPNGRKLEFRRPMHCWRRARRH